MLSRVEGIIPALESAHAIAMLSNWPSVDRTDYHCGIRKRR